MEINFENRSVDAWREFSRQGRRVQVTMESVVPDVNDDIGRIASIQTAVLLKEKEIVGRGAYVAGEVQATVLYITENAEAVAALHLSKAFDLDYELGESEGETLAQIRLTVVQEEARILNPRKLSLTVEVSGELSAFRRQEIPVETLLPPEIDKGIHVLRDSAEAALTEAVCEKSFLISEQFAFPDGKAEPSALIGQSIAYTLGELQQIGSRLVLKGTVDLNVYYFSEAVDYPLRVSFSAPFSQIVEIGAEDCGCCSASLETSSVYADLIDSINGGKSLDLEIHAVLQIAARRKQPIGYIADAYSNEMPLQCELQEEKYPVVSEMQTVEWKQELEAAIAEDCADILCILPNLGPAVSTAEALSVPLNLDVIYRGQSGELSCVRRSLSIKGEALEQNSRVASVDLRSLDLYPGGSGVIGNAGVAVRYQVFDTGSYDAVKAVCLSEEQRYDPSSLPSLSVVYPRGESLWQLAKRYHSSIESIQALNEADARVVLIPRES